MERKVSLPALSNNPSKCTLPSFWCKCILAWRQLHFTERRRRRRRRRRSEKEALFMRPEIVLFGDSITEQSFRSGGWGAALADTYSRKDSKKPPAAATIFFGANDAAILGEQECSPAILIVLITPPPVDEDGRNEYARSLYGEDAREEPERMNEVTGVYAKKCIELAEEMGLRSINLWSKLQETEGWQKKFLSDGLHLTPEGNAVVHQEVVRDFREAWFSAEEMPHDFPHHSNIDEKNPGKAFQQRCA
ncbi:SGNH hydrolase-type esterase superfamily protein [Prunus dulcis]|uniref:SGNH hydrolase-type esterase superfamily protein n=1 Tax=Prunus dulcis TaxID=3755 RepID=A0A4Y1RHQ3_PRUDU|nr:SGNH hydrolase-type esterase superfamily protein [Prunus dulcis]